jgi:NAD(P)H-hydrate epimerase
VFEPGALLRFLRRDPDTHKGTYGRLLVLSGSTGKTGAACLCSEAALRCGAGLVTLGIPAPLNPILEGKLTEVMTLPLPSTSEGVLSRKAVDMILESAGAADGLIIGPGLGVTEDTERIVREVWLQVDKPMVWDADALTLLARCPDLKGRQRADIVVTPHPGEMGRLVERTAGWVQENRVEAVKAFCEQWKVVTVLKGARTLIGEPDGGLRINPTGNPGMASGGMGDVLTGMIGGLMFQGMGLYDAASLGVWLHGAAGDRVAAEQGPLGFVASEVMGALPGLYKRLTEECAWDPKD